MIILEFGICQANKKVFIKEYGSADKTQNMAHICALFA